MSITVNASLKNTFVILWRVTTDIQTQFELPFNTLCITMTSIIFRVSIELVLVVLSMPVVLKLFPSEE